MRVLDRRAVLFLLLTALFLGAIFYQYQLVSSNVSETENGKRRFQAESITALNFIEELAFLHKNYPEFQNLTESQHVIDRRELVDNNNLDSQRKVSWIKHLESAKNHLAIAEMNFDIYPYRPVADGLQGLMISIGVESIVLRVSLLHDGVLAQLLTYLKEYAPNPFVISSLEVERIQSADTSTTQINAVVTMAWHLIDVDGVSDAVSS